MNTNWSTPKRNIIAGLLDLRSALAAGQNAVLIKKANEDCAFPIYEKQQDTDFRNYEFSSGHASSIKTITDDDSMSEQAKILSTNYVNRYGTPEAVKHYYETRELSPDNDKGMGKSHLVHIEDYLEYLLDTKQYDRERLYRRQYYPNHGDTTVHFFDFYRYKQGSPYAKKKFKTKLWVVQLMDDKVKVPWAVRLLNVFMFPFKFIPKKHVLNMDKYKVVTFRIGSVQNGFSLELGIPKKFGFN